jgi:hypothetical protein
MQKKRDIEIKVGWPASLVARVGCSSFTAVTKQGSGFKALCVWKMSFLLFLFSTSEEPLKAVDEILATYTQQQVHHH